MNFKIDSVTLQDVRKSYGSDVAVESFTTSVAQGITALLGPNGAGKSTLFRMIAGLTKPQSGSVSVFGQDPYREHRQVAMKVGVLPEQDGLFDNVSAAKQLELYARLFGSSASAAKESVANVLASVDLSEFANKKVKSFSKGMRKRLAIARSLVNNPDLLLLDEPTEGLDPVQVMKLRELMLKLSREGKTILYNTHNLSEVAKVADHILVMQKGRLVFSGDRETFEELSGSKGSASALEDAYKDVLVGVAGPATNRLEPAGVS